MPVTGPVLRDERKDAKVVTVTAVAARMGLSRQAVHRLEGAATVADEQATAYREAVTAERVAKMASREGE